MVAMAARAARVIAAVRRLLRRAIAAAAAVVATAGSSTAIVIVAVVATLRLRPVPLRPVPPRPARPRLEPLRSELRRCCSGCRSGSAPAPLLPPRRRQKPESARKLFRAPLVNVSFRH